jgi:hypothetical protein
MLDTLWKYSSLLSIMRRYSIDHELCVCCLEYIEEEEAFTSFHETRYATVGEFSPIIIKN